VNVSEWFPTEPALTALSLAYAIKRPASSTGSQVTRKRVAPGQNRGSRTPQMMDIAR
jgi:hypothetical protein